jgi:hypothetical protein
MVVHIVDENENYVWLLSFKLLWKLFKPETNDFMIPGLEDLSVELISISELAS